MKKTFLVFAILALLPACGSKEEPAKPDEGQVKKLREEAFEAARSGKLEELKELFGKGVDVNWKDEEGQTLLHHAAAWHDEKVLRFLIAEGAPLEAKDAKGNTPLHAACGWSSMGDMARILLNSGADPNAKNKEYETPLHLAVQHPGYPEFGQVDDLLRAGADINAKDIYERTPLDRAVDGRNPRVIPYLRKKGAHAGYIAAELHEAVKHEDTDRVKELIARGVDVNELDNPGKMTPLHYAAMLDYIEVARILVDAGAKIDALSHRTGTPLHCALSGGNEEMARFLVDKGADTKKWCRPWRESANTCLHLAVATGKPGLVTLMLDSGLEVDVRGSWFRTPLHDAVIHGHRQVVELLIARGADVNAVRALLLPDKGIMPLDIAMHRKHVDIAQLLRSEGAKRWDDLSEEERKEKSKILEDFKP